jgi:hypothetical protein
VKRAFLFLRLATLAACLSTSAPSSFASEILAGLGSDNFTVTFSNTPYSQTATNLTLSAPFNLAGSVGGAFGTVYNWSGISDFSLLMSAPGESPDVFFTIRFFDQALDELLNAYQGSASGLNEEPSLVLLEFVPEFGATGDLSAVGGFQFSWNSSSPDGYEGSVQIFGVVPEPSTWALLALGGAVGGLAWVRRRRT